MSNQTFRNSIIGFAFLAGGLTYLMNKFFIRYYMQLLPVALFILIVTFVLHGQLRKRFKPAAGGMLLFLSILIPLTVLYLLMVFFPLPGMLTLRLSEQVLRYFAVIGISLIVASLMYLYTYRSEGLQISLRRKGPLSSAE